MAKFAALYLTENAAFYLTVHSDTVVYHKAKGA